MTAIHVHIDSPFLTKKEFMARTGMKESTLNSKIDKDEIPTFKTDPSADPDSSKGLVLINMVKLYELAASGHKPITRSQTSTRKLNRG